MRLKFRKYLGGMGKGTYIVFKYCFEKNASKNFANILVSYKEVILQVKNLKFDYVTL